MLLGTQMERWMEFLLQAIATLHHKLSWYLNVEHLVAVGAICFM
jgi:hypothetical protein